MPARLGLAAVGEAKLSDGTRLTTLDWRANRLADALAKAAARRRIAGANTDATLAVAAKAVRHAARLLGRVTFAANNHVVTEVGPDGKSCTRVIRDASQPGSLRPVPAPPAGHRRQPAAHGADGAQAQEQPRPLLQFQRPTPISEPLVPHRARPASVPARQQRRAAAPSPYLMRLRECLRPMEGPTAAERLDALRDRIRARAASACVL